MKLKDLVKKKKSELVGIADFGSASQMKKSELIKKLAEGKLTESQKELLDSNAQQVKATAEDLGINYTTKKETLSKIVEKLNNQESESNEEEKTGSWYDEFRDAVDLAVRRTLSEKRSYKVLSTEEENTFNVSPRYMKHDENRNVLLTVNIFENVKEML